MSDLKLFVWEGQDVLPVVATGLICVLAHDIEEALQLIEQKYNHSTPDGDRSNCYAYFPHGTFMQHFPQERYKVIEHPAAFALHGSDY